ncbi:MAG: glycosyltransferase [Oscillospiraceae bacterium]|nr:glycosyltransferase [Oscillospiraceae bacterium]
MKYSILMSVYQKEKPEYLVQSIESMLSQTAFPEQFVIVKDGPLTPELDEILCQYAASYPDLFTILPLTENVGLGRALDLGMAVCRNELVARMDSDDISLPSRCQRELERFAADPELAIVGTNIDEFYDDPSDIKMSRVVPSEYADIKKAIGRRMPFNHPTVMYKKSEVMRCGGYGTMRRKQDRDLFSRMINMDCKACNINESLLLFRSNEDNYRRRKSWTYCKSTVDVTVQIWKRGHCSFADLLYVIVGQAVLFVVPLPVMKILSDKLLRSPKK